MKKYTGLALLVCGLTTSACSSIDTLPRFVGGEPFTLPADLRGVAGVRYATAEISPQALTNHMWVRASDDLWPSVDPGDIREQYRRDQLRREMDMELRQDVAMEVEEELKACAKGPRDARMLDAAVRVEDIVYGGPEWARTGDDEIFATVELFEVDTSVPVARYSIRASSPRRFSMEGPRRDEGISISINDREDSMAEWLGREVCREAFGSSVRPSRWRNLTN